MYVVHPPFLNTVAWIIKTTHKEINNVRYLPKLTHNDTKMTSEQTVQLYILFLLAETAIALHSAYLAYLKTEVMLCKAKVRYWEPVEKWSVVYPNNITHIQMKLSQRKSKWHGQTHIPNSSEIDFYYL